MLTGTLAAIKFRILPLEIDPRCERKAHSQACRNNEDHERDSVSRRAKEEVRAPYIGRIAKRVYERDSRGSLRLGLGQGFGDPGEDHNRGAVGGSREEQNGEVPCADVESRHRDDVGYEAQTQRHDDVEEALGAPVRVPAVDEHDEYAQDERRRRQAVGGALIVPQPADDRREEIHYGADDVGCVEYARQ